MTPRTLDERPTPVDAQTTEPDVPGFATMEIEAVRRLLDPIQSRLIPAHVTLCREDELGKLSDADLESRLSGAHLKPVTLHFGRPEAFDGHGVLLRCTGGEEGFRVLREQVLGSTEIRRQAPHITLAHPRNPKSPDNCLANASHLPEVTSITFPSVSLIEQKGSVAWSVVREFVLSGS